MKTKLLRVLSFLMALAMAFSMASCTSSCDKDKKSKKKKKDQSTAVTDKVTDDGSYYYSYWSSAAWGDIDEGDLYDDNDNFGDLDTDSSQQDYQIVIARPEADSDLKNGISTGEQLKYNDGDDLGDFDDFDDFDDPDVDDITTTDTTLTLEDCSSPIQKLGEAVDGDVRTINVTNDEVVFKHFDGFGTNVFPTYGTLRSQQEDNGNKAYLELNYKRFNDVAHSWARSWFQIDWMTTDEAGDDYVKYLENPTKNPDYINYMNGVYWLTDDNEIMKSCIEYWEMLDEAGTEVYLAFGWKVGTRAQHWFSEEPTRARIAAPKDCEKYAEAAAALFHYCREDKGLTNFNTIAWYNEPSRVEDSSWRGTWDYATSGDKRVYWANMVRATYENFKADAALKDVKIASADVSDGLHCISDDYVDVYLMKRYPQYVDMVTRHAYPGSLICRGLNDTWSSLTSYAAKYEKRNGEIVKGGTFLYDQAYDYLNLNRYLFSPNGDGENAYDFYLTEVYNFSYDITYDSSGEAGAYAWDINEEQFRNTYWRMSSTAYLMACVNTGTHASFNWGTVGGTLLDPTSFCVGDGDTGAWRFPRSNERALDVRALFYEYSIWGNYVRKDSNVNMVSWDGDDILVSALTSADGKDFSLVVEKNYTDNNLTFNVNLTESLGGKTLYVYRCVNTPEITVDQDAQATIPTKFDTISDVKSSFTYTDDTEKGKEYAVYIITTIKPVKQLELYKSGTSEQAVALKVRMSDIEAGNNTISIDAKRVDTPASDTLNWEIKLYYEAPVLVKKTDTNPPHISYYYKEYKITQYPSVRRHEIAGSDCGTIVQNGDSVTYTFPADCKVGDTIALRCTVVDDTPNNTADDRYASTVIEIV